MRPHPSLAWPRGEPTELDGSARRLAGLADLITVRARAWNPPHQHTTWSGRAAWNNTRAIDVIRESCADLAEPLRNTAQMAWTLAGALRQAQEQITVLARRLDSAEKEATASNTRARTADEDARAQEMRAIVAPFHLPVARSARTTANVLASAALRDEAERRILLLSSIRRAGSIVADFTTVDRSTAAEIDHQLRGVVDGSRIAPPPLVQFGTPERRILVWDSTGDGIIVEVFGDLSTAQHIAVLVPGVMNTKGNFDVMVAERAKSLYETSIVVEPSVAVVAWLGYDTPELLNGVSKQRARQDEHRLREFMDSLPPVHVTIVAHSYGSVLAGEAALVGLPADDLVLIGSPGTSLETADDAHLAPGAQIWAGVSDTDVIGRTGWGSFLCPEVIGGAGAFSVTGMLNPSYPAAFLSESCQTDADGDVLALSHGVNPAHDQFGAIEINTDGVAGHSSYLDHGTTSVQAIAAIITGRHESQH